MAFWGQWGLFTGQVTVPGDYRWSSYRTNAPFMLNARLWGGLVAASGGKAVPAPKGRQQPIVRRLPNDWITKRD